MSEHQIDFELQMQRCIDGELDEQAQVNFLNSLDEHADTDAWKKLSLGFIENQVLDSYFSNFDEDSTLIDRPLPARTDKVEQRTRNEIRSPYAMAAAVTIGLFLGFGANHFNRFQSENSIVESRPTSSATSPITTTEFPVQVRQPPTQEDLALIDSSHQENPKTQHAASPLYRLSDVDGSNSDWIHQQQFLQELRRRGYALERSQTPQRYHIGNGQEVVVPSETILIRHAIH